MFHDVSGSHSFPINVAAVIRTRHCRLQRSCIEGSSGSVGFKTAINCFSLPRAAALGATLYTKCESKVFGTHVTHVGHCSTMNG